MSVRLEALRVAATQIGVRETSRNSGPEVDAYLASVGCAPGLAWCAAFVHWCFEAGAASLTLPDPCPKTAGALRLHEMASSSQANVYQPEPGDVFVIDHGHGLGHVGFVESVGPIELAAPAARVGPIELVTIEGNTNPGGSREGDGVYRRTRRRDEVNRGYLRIGN